MTAHVASPIDRRAERVHMFLVATLYCDGASKPVRVRNLSGSGALVEGAAFPPVGATVTLRRGALEAVGRLVWSGSGKAGLSFSGPVDVSAWLPVKEAQRQTQVDQIAFKLKHAAHPVGPHAFETVGDATMSSVAVVAELIALRADLDRLGDKLAEDKVVLASHPEVQFLDAAGQRIGKIVDALRTANG